MAFNPNYTGGNPNTGDLIGESSSGNDDNNNTFFDQRGATIANEQERERIKELRAEYANQQAKQIIADQQERQRLADQPSFGSKIQEAIDKQATGIVSLISNISPLYQGITGVLKSLAPSPEKMVAQLQKRGAEPIYSTEPVTELRLGEAYNYNPMIGVYNPITQGVTPRSLGDAFGSDPNMKEAYERARREDVLSGRGDPGGTSGDGDFSGGIADLANPVTQKPVDLSFDFEDFIGRNPEFRIRGGLDPVFTQPVNFLI